MENLTITTGPSAGGVTGDRSGIYAQQFGYAALDITANGNLAGLRHHCAEQFKQYRLW
ncbi:MAG: hypothetical protein R3D30_03610 [Hyphomicrobiales bacterium]